MNITIRKAGIADAKDIANIGRQSFYEAFVSIFQNEKDLEVYLDHTYAIPHIEESIAKPNNVFFIAFDADKATGFAKMKLRSQHKTISSSRQTELQKIYVLKEYHGTGVGQALMNAVIQQSKETGTEDLWLDVHIVNAKAKKFYEKNGFQKAGDHRFTIGTQEFYYDVLTLPLAVHA